MSYTIKTIETDKYKLEVGLDEGYELEDIIFCDEDEIFYSNVPRYLGDVNTKGKTLEDFESLKDIQEYHGPDFKVYKVNAYIHSGIVLSLGEGYPFNCQWDSGLGGILVLPKVFNAESFIETFNQCLAGEVYYYTLKEKLHCECCNNTSFETIDSLGFILGDIKEVILENIYGVEIDGFEKLLKAINEKL